MFGEDMRLFLLFRQESKITDLDNSVNGGKTDAVSILREGNAERDSIR